MKILNIPRPIETSTEETNWTHIQSCVAQDQFSETLVMRPDGLFFDQMDTKPDAQPIWICQAFDIRGYTRGSDGTTWGILIDFINDDQKLITCVIERRNLLGNGTQLIAFLAGNGFRVAFDQKNNKVLLRALFDWSGDTRYTTTSRSGWMHDNSAFVLPDGQVIGSQNIIFDGVRPSAADTRGSLQGWKENVASFCADNPLLTVAVSAAFAGPCLELLGIESGGLHFRGYSSSGKTTLLHVAQSVWSGKILRWRTTDNALENLAAGRNNTLLCLDELGEMDGRGASDAIYMLGNGEGKQRRNPAGGVHNTQMWRQMILSSGEITVAEKLSEGGRTAQAGQEVRLLDIPADTQMFSTFDTLHGFPDGRSFSDALKANASRNCGTAGAAFVRKLLADLPKAKEDLERMMAHFDKKAALKIPGLKNGVVARAQKRFALIAAAGEMARVHEITGWQKGASIDAAIQCFELWMLEQGAAFVRPLEAAVEKLVQFTKSAAVADIGSASTSQTALAWQSGDLLYVSSEGWEQIYGQHAAKKSAQLLLLNDILIAADGRNIKSKTPSTLKEPTRAYKIDLNALNAFSEKG